PDRERWIGELRRRQRPADFSVLVQDVLAAYNADDAAAMKRLNNYTGQNVTVDHLRKMLQKRLGKAAGSELTLDEARMFVALAHDFPSWDALEEQTNAKEEKKES